MSQTQTGFSVDDVLSGKARSQEQRDRGIKMNQLEKDATACNLKTSSRKLTSLLSEISSFDPGHLLGDVWGKKKDKLEERLFKLISIKSSRKRFWLTVSIACVGWGLWAFEKFFSACPPCQ
ncbi:MAG TPA: hypothetical protein DHV36_20150 [Desulfobacteraceae bacterium]|nr:hypothetical protein [Desulfobacteraceae bacterium]